jgi:hypothetical protein
MYLSFGNDDEEVVCGDPSPLSEHLQRSIHDEKIVGNNMFCWFILFHWS